MEVCYLIARSFLYAVFPVPADARVALLLANKGLKGSDRISLISRIRHGKVTTRDPDALFPYSPIVGPKPFSKDTV